jgi:predicted ATPase
LRATLEWSYELLPEIERVVLRHLSIFTGGFSLEAARAVIAGADFSPRSSPAGSQISSPSRW